MAAQSLPAKSQTTTFTLVRYRAGSMKLKLALLLLTVVLIGIFGFKWYNKSLKIDNCLDQGGRWNQETEVCNFKSLAYYKQRVTQLRNEKNYTALEMTVDSMIAEKVILQNALI